MVEVSVVITTFNRPDYLEKAIRTVINQTFKDLEILIVDGANSKNNKDVVEQFNDRRILYVPVESYAVNYPSYKGIQHSRNVGCKKAIGEYIAMLDDDDTWTEDKLEKQMKIFERDAKNTVGLVISYTLVFNEEMRVIEKTKNLPTYSELLKSFNLSTTSAFLIRRDILSKIEYWNEELRGMHEYDIALKIAKEGYEIVVIPEPLMIRYWFEKQKRHYTDFSHNYYIKIAEILDLWKYYSRDFIKYIGLKGFLFNSIRAIVLIGIFLLGYIVKDKIWNVLYKLKMIYEKVVVLPKK
jgi:glycosyltransferase involved in cell wall biosynthesis